MSRRLSCGALAVVVGWLVAVVAGFGLFISSAVAAIVPVQQAELSPSDAFDGGFGEGSGAIAIYGSTAVVGNPYYDSADNDGRVYVFVRSGTTWTQQAELSNIPQGGTEFGSAVGIYGSTIVVSAPYAWSAPCGYCGAVYVFVRSGTTWTQQAELTPPDGLAGNFGRSLSIYGSTLIVGADAADQAYVFAGSGGVWSLAGTLTSPLGVGSGDGFGSSVALRDRTAIVGAPATNAGTGAAYVFGRQSNGAWSQQATLTAADGTAGGQFGSSTRISGPLVVVGAPFEHGTGAAYIFSRFTSGTQQTELTPADGASGDNFGSSVAIANYGSTGTVVIGADGKNSATGAAYLFTGSGPTWTQNAEMTASNASAYASFGSSAAISGGTAVIGAPSANPYGVGGAYVFTGL